jgi:hypothetical protein
LVGCFFTQKHERDESKGAETGGRSRGSKANLLRDKGAEAGGRRGTAHLSSCKVLLSEGGLGLERWRVRLRRSAEG